MSFPITSRRTAGIAATAIFLFASLAVRPALAAGAEMKKADKANYDLASRWVPAKVGKLVFDTSVSPHWLETGDRFWYTYETSQGRKWYLVDPAAKTKR
ncbi:MAG: hypothetical protein IH583_04845, partial [Candidatus Aminicenantes bacterium]|nr:hypothetical protein [Candidatus Aminicenantes bacterium]